MVTAVMFEFSVMRCQPLRRALCVSVGDGMQHIDKLIEIAKRKSNFDENNSWYQGSSTYLVEIKKKLMRLLKRSQKIVRVISKMN